MRFFIIIQPRAIFVEAGAFHLLNEIQSLMKNLVPQGKNPSRAEVMLWAEGQVWNRSTCTQVPSFPPTHAS
jgi:hypothetical protein